MIDLDFDKQGGLVPAVVQDAGDKTVLMVAYLSPESWQKTLATGEAHYWSRTRQEIWHKGGTSGHVQKIKAIWIDCDRDTVLLEVEQVGGAACHTGHRSCFHQRVEGDSLVIEGEPVFDPEKVYGK
jgi:phosphoribosyl-AMP cyclohydrolase